MIHRTPGAAPSALRMDLCQRQVWLDEQPCAMADRAFDLLAALALRPGQAMTAEALLSAVWPNRVVEGVNLRVQVRALRRALGAGAVVNVHGRGYALATQHTEPAAMLHQTLPAAGAPLLGRQEELWALTQLTARARLVTVLGPAGIGKTSLALAAARQAAQQGHEPLAWVDLARLPAPGGPHGQVGTALAVAVAEALGLPRDPLDPATQQPALLSPAGMAHLHGCVVLDNAEHLCGPGSGALPGLLERLLACAPRLHWLVTSQQPLRLREETPFRLGALEVPGPDEDLQQVRNSPAVQLMVRRATALDQGFQLRDPDLPHAAAVVRRLDGLPLAIELAATRLPLLGARLLHEMLDERFRLLVQPATRQPDRQATLAAALAWNMGLLADHERCGLLWLSVFVAPRRLETAQALLAGLPHRPGPGADILSALVDKSLLQVEAPRAPDTGPRVRLLESVRLYARADLYRAGVDARRQAERQVVQVMAQAAQAALSDFYRSSDALWLARWWPDHEDIQQAFDIAYTLRQAEWAAPLMEWLVLSANISAQVHPAIDRMPAARSLAEEAAPRDRARLLSFTQPHQAGGPSRLGGAQARVRAWQAVADARGLCVAWAALASVAESEGDTAAADAALAACQALEDPDWPARLRRRCAWLALSAMALSRGDAGHLAAARATADRLLPELEALGATGEALLVGMQVAQLARLRGHRDEAVAGLRGIIAAHRQTLRRLDVAHGLGLLCAALLEGTADTVPHPPEDPAVLADARAAAAEALDLLQPFPVVARHFLEALPWLAWCAGDLQAAAQWQAACDALRQRMAAAADRLNTRLADRTRAALARDVGAQALAQAREAVQGWSLEDLLNRVRAWLQPAVVGRLATPPGRWSER